MRQASSRVHISGNRYQGEDGEETIGGTPVIATSAFRDVEDIDGDGDSGCTIEDLEWRMKHLSKSLEAAKLAIERLKVQKEKERQKDKDKDKDRQNDKENDKDVWKMEEETDPY